MAKSRPRPDDDDDDMGYEIVDNTPARKPVPKPPSAKPSSSGKPTPSAKPTATGKPLPSAKPLTAKPVATAKPATPISKPATAKPKSLADTKMTAKDATHDDFEVIDDEPPKKKPAKAQVDDEFEVVDEFEEKPKKKKKLKLSDKDRERIKAEKRAVREEQKQNEMVEWAAPIFLTVLGLAMIVVSAVIMSGRPGWGIGVGIMLVATFVWTILLIPIVIVSLMFIGMVCGIEYGTITNAIRSLTAITFMVNGIYWLGNLMGPLGWWLAPGIASMTAFALFMLFFSLDTQETSTSLFCLNIILWIADKIFIVVVVIAIAKWGGNVHRDVGDDDPPQVGNNGAQFDPGDGGKRGNRGVDPDDDN